MQKEVGVLTLGKIEEVEVYAAGYNPNTAGIAIPMADDFNDEQVEYLFAITGRSILRDLKGELLNIIEGIGLSERQETAVKRLITNALHGWHRNFKEDINIVNKSD